MGTTYDIKLTDDRGTVITSLTDWESLDYVVKVNDVGVCSLVLPGDWEWSLFAPDRKLEIWRKPEGGNLALERAYLIRGRKRWRDTNGTRRIQLTGYDGVHLLSRRIVAYASGSAQASITDEIDDMMKTVVKQNLGADATDTDRAFNASYFSVQANLTAGPSVTRSFSRRNVLTVLQELSEASKEAGTAIYFDVVSPEPSKYEFRTYSTQPGQDHTETSGDAPVKLGITYGNMAEPSLDEDYADEATVIYGGGQGEGADRYIYELEDAARTGRSLWGRMESFRDARNEVTQAGAQAATQEALAAGKPRIRFGGQLIDSPGTRYGIHYRCGDKVTAIDEGASYDAIIWTVHVKVGEQRQEDIDARFEYEE